MDSVGALGRVNGTLASLAAPHSVAPLTRPARPQRLAFAGAPPSSLPAVRFGLAHQHAIPTCTWYARAGDEVCSCEGRQEVVERLLVRQIDDAEAEADLGLVRCEQLPVPIPRSSRCRGARTYAPHRS